MSAPAVAVASETSVVVVNVPGAGLHVGVAAFGGGPLSPPSGSGGGGGGGGITGGGGGGGFGGGGVVVDVVGAAPLEESSPPQAIKPAAAVPVITLATKSALTASRILMAISCSSLHSTLANRREGLETQVDKFAMIYF
jgi:hypothetical protein